MGSIYATLHTQAGSGLNQAEIEISLFSRQSWGSTESLTDLRREAQVWNRKNESQPCHHQLDVYRQNCHKFRYKKNMFLLSES